MVYSIELIENDQLILITWQANAGNFLNEESLTEFHQMLDEIEDPSNENKYYQKPIILKSSDSSPIFSAGMDLKVALKASKNDPKLIKSIFGQVDRLFMRLCCLNHRTIAQIDGHAIAGGFFIGLACDTRIGLNNPKIKIGITEIAVGIPFPSFCYMLMNTKLSNQVNWDLLIATPNKLHTPENAFRKLGYLNGICDSKQELKKQCIKEALRIDKNSMNAYLYVKKYQLAPVVKQWQQEKDKILKEFVTFVQSPQAQKRLQTMIATRLGKGVSFGKPKL